MPCVLPILRQNKIKIQNSIQILRLKFYCFSATRLDPDRDCFFDKKNFWNLIKLKMKIVDFFAKHVTLSVSKIQFLESLLTPLTKTCHFKINCFLYMKMGLDGEPATLLEGAGCVRNISNFSKYFFTLLWWKQAVKLDNYCNEVNIRPTLPQ